MSFVSYAQNFEDIMLWRALKHIEKGFYIDIGANDPTVDSVTKAFYDRGWYGINIEPLPSHYADLVKERDRDINLQCAAGAEAGEIEIWECDVRGWGTACPNVISQHSQNGHEGVFHRVALSPLKNICSQYVTGDIHFLKIDVEGIEKSVIDGMELSRFRPWIMVIEATKPNSSKEVYSEWEQTVISNGYLLAYTDGLNRFYVAKEHNELLEAFRYPPNVFDAFIRAEQLNSELRAQQALDDLQQAQKLAQESSERAEQAIAREEQSKANLHFALEVAQQAQEHSQDLLERTEQAEAREAASKKQVDVLNEELASVRRELDEVHHANHNHWLQLEQTRQKLHDVHQANHHNWTLAEERYRQIESLVNSRSWRFITSFQRLKGISNSSEISNSLKSRLKPLIKHAALYINRRPKLRDVAIKTLNRFPAIKVRIKHIVTPADPIVVSTSQSVHVIENDGFQYLSPQTKQIYNDLKTAIERIRESG